MMRLKGYEWSAKQRAGRPYTYPQIMEIARLNGADGLKDQDEFLLGALDYGRWAKEPRPIIFLDAKPITSAEIAEANGLTQRRIRQLCERGELLARRQGKLWFVGYEDYCQWWLGRHV